VQQHSYLIEKQQQGDLKTQQALDGQDEKLNKILYEMQELKGFLPKDFLTMLVPLLPTIAEELGDLAKTQNLSFGNVLKASKMKVPKLSKP